MWTCYDAAMTCHATMSRSGVPPSPQVGCNPPEGMSWLQAGRPTQHHLRKNEEENQRRASKVEECEEMEMAKFGICGTRNAMPMFESSKDVLVMVNICSGQCNSCRAITAPAFRPPPVIVTIHSIISGPPTCKIRLIWAQARYILYLDIFPVGHQKVDRIPYQLIDVMYYVVYPKKVICFSFARFLPKSDCMLPVVPHQWRMFPKWEVYRERGLAEMR